MDTAEAPQGSVFGRALCGYASKRWRVGFLHPLMDEAEHVHGKCVVVVTEKGEVAFSTGKWLVVLSLSHFGAWDSHTAPYLPSVIFRRT